ELTQAVIRSGVGISTPSIMLLSNSKKLLLIVLSALTWDCLTRTELITYCAFSFSHRETLRLLIASKSTTDFFQSHSYICFARKPCSPICTSCSFSCSKERLRISVNFVFAIAAQRYGNFFCECNVFSKQPAETK